MANEDQIFGRLELLMGAETVERIGQKRVILFGVGGVGSWCAESLVRSGICHLTIVDSDCVCTSNINRQLMATTKTVGQAKVDVLKERLLSINPQAEIAALQKVFNEETAHEFEFDSYDYIIDAIDSLKDKALLILMATQTKAKLFQWVPHSSWIQRVSKSRNSGRFRAILWPAHSERNSNIWESTPSASSSASLAVNLYRKEGAKPHAELWPILPPYSASCWPAWSFRITCFPKKVFALFGVLDLLSNFAHSIE